MCFRDKDEQQQEYLSENCRYKIFHEFRSHFDLAKDILPFTFLAFSCIYFPFFPRTRTRTRSPSPRPETACVGKGVFLRRFHIAVLRVVFMAFVRKKYIKSFIHRIGKSRQA